MKQDPYEEPEVVDDAVEPELADDEVDWVVPEDDDEPLDISADMLHPERDFEKGMRVFPPLCAALGVACLVAFVGQVVVGAFDSQKAIVAAGALAPKEVASGELWRLVSAMFLHGNFEHLLGNLLMLYILGMACEHAYGWAQALCLYLVAGVVGSLFSVTAGHVSVGASGAIFGLAGALVIFFKRHRHQLYLRDKRIGFVVGVWAVFQVGLGFLNPGIDNLAHLGGLLGGAAMAMVLQPAILKGRAEVTRHPVTLAGLIVSLLCLGATAIFLAPRLVP